MNRGITICLLEGDGIGPEVVRAAKSVLDCLPVQFLWREAPIGFGCYQALGTPLPETTLQAVRESDAALFGAVTTPPDIPGYRSPILQLRQKLNLFANVRPCQSIPAQVSRPGINLVVVRENTEDLYVGREKLEDDGETAIAEMVITRAASERIARYAFELARRSGRKRVTVVHKANVLRQTSGLFRRVALQAAADYPDLHVDEMLVDACAMDLIRSPESFDVLVTTNLFGDILSDEASMLVGGLGTACSGNIGAQAAVFEPVHGSAPNLAGKDIANPVAAILSAAMLLEHVGLKELGDKVRQALNLSITQGQTTADLGGTLGTRACAEAICDHLRGIL